MTPHSPIVTAARGWIGTPYRHQASRKGVGCDCLGLARGVWRELVGPEPALPPPYSRDWGEVDHREVLVEGAAEFLIRRPYGDPRPGDLVIFRMKDRAIAKHIGILIGETRFVHALERIGVVEQALTDPWRRRIAFVFRFPATGSS